MSDPGVTAGSSATLLSNRAFLRLWVAQVVSNAGSKVTGLALPLTAVLLLRATPAQMALLVVAGQLPNVLFGLLAGVWVDRTPRRPILVGADLGRAMLLGTIPAAALLGHLTFAQLWAVGFLAASLGVFFQLASVAVLPSLVPKDRLVEANSALSISDSVLSVAGPGLAGGLIQIVGPPKAIIVDSASYVLSALSLRGIGAHERRTNRPPRRRGVWLEIAEGVRELQRTPLLGALTWFLAVGAAGWAAQSAALLLFLVRTLGFTPAMVGLIGACDGAAALVAAICASRAVRLLGAGPTVILGSLIETASDVIIPLAAFAPSSLSLPVVIAAKMLAATGVVFATVPSLSIRQALTPTELLGRVTAARRFLIVSLGLAGSALGGFLGTQIGVFPTLFVAVPFSLASSLVVLLSPVRDIRELPAAGARP